MRRFLLILSLALLALPGWGRRPSWIPAPYEPQRLVNDFAGIFSVSQRDSLERVLVAFDDSTSNQITVVSVQTLAGHDVDEFAVRLANEWGIGTKKRNNGVLVLIKPRGRDNNYIDVTIQVGRGLEGAIPDAYASRIIRNIMGPFLRQDLYFQAIVKGCDELKALAAGEISEPRDGETEPPGWLILGIFLLFIIGLVLLLVLLDKYNRKHGGTGLGGGGGSGWGGGPIIFGGGGGHSHSGWGGGSFGGGGFGGFGGGSFGGGGASGRF